MQKVSQILGQPVMIVNKPGAGSSIGYREVHRAKPDGYTTGWGSATLISNKLQGISLSIITTSPCWEPLPPISL